MPRVLTRHTPPGEELGLSWGTIPSRPWILQKGSYPPPTFRLPPSQGESISHSVAHGAPGYWCSWPLQHPASVGLSGFRRCSWLGPSGADLMTSVFKAVISTCGCWSCTMFPLEALLMLPIPCGLLARSVRFLRQAGHQQLQLPLPHLDQLLKVLSQLRLLLGCVSSSSRSSEPCPSHKSPWRPYRKTCRAIREEHPPGFTTLNKTLCSVHHSQTPRF